MLEVGSFEAKTHLPALLNRVMSGEEIIITRRGKAIAKLSSYPETAGEEQKKRTAKALKEIKKIRAQIKIREKKRGLAPLSIAEIKAMINEGRR